MKSKIIITKANRTSLNPLLILIGWLRSWNKKKKPRKPPISLISRMLILNIWISSMTHSSMTTIRIINRMATPNQLITMISSITIKIRITTTRTRQVKMNKLLQLTHLPIQYLVKSLMSSLQLLIITMLRKVKEITMINRRRRETTNMEIIITSEGFGWLK